MTNNKFLGHNGFLWFTGVVEDRNDPNKARQSTSESSWPSYV